MAKFLLVDLDKFYAYLLCVSAAKGNKWNPTVTIQGKAGIQMAPLVLPQNTAAGPAPAPAFAQLYCLDPEMADKELAIRVSNLEAYVPDNISKKQKQILGKARVSTVTANWELQSFMKNILKITK